MVGGGPEREEEDASSLREVVCNAEDGLDGFFFFLFVIMHHAWPGTVASLQVSNAHQSRPPLRIYFSRPSVKRSKDALRVNFAGLWLGSLCSYAALFFPLLLRSSVSRPTEDAPFPLRERRKKGKQKDAAKPARSNQLSHVQSFW